MSKRMTWDEKCEIVKKSGIVQKLAERRKRREPAQTSRRVFNVLRCELPDKSISVYIREGDIVHPDEDVLKSFKTLKAAEKYLNAL